MSQKLDTSPAVIGIDIGKNSFHIVGQNQRGAIVLRQKWSRGQLGARLANLPPCRIGMEACVGAHHLSRTLQALGHDARLMPAKYVRPYSKGQKNDYRDAEAIAEAVQRPTMKFVATKTADQLDLQALHRVRERFVGQRTGIINQIPEHADYWSALLKRHRFLVPPAQKISAKIGGKKSYRAVSSASDFRNDGWAQPVKNLSAISGYFAGNPVVEQRHVIDGRPRNFTKNARTIYGGPNA